MEIVPVNVKSVLQQNDLWNSILFETFLGHEKSPKLSMSIKLMLKSLHILLNRSLISSISIGDGLDARLSSGFLREVRNVSGIKYRRNWKH